MQVAFELVQLFFIGRQAIAPVRVTPGTAEKRDAPRDAVYAGPRAVRGVREIYQFAKIRDALFEQRQSVLQVVNVVAVTVAEDKSGSPGLGPVILHLGLNAAHIVQEAFVFVLVASNIRT